MKSLMVSQFTYAFHHHFHCLQSTRSPTHNLWILLYLLRSSPSRESSKSIAEVAQQGKQKVSKFMYQKTPAQAFFKLKWAIK